MSEQPFKDSEVLWRWTPTGEEDWCRNLVAQEYIITGHEFFWRTGTIWNGRDMVGPWVGVAQLLRELTAAKGLLSQAIEPMGSDAIDYATGKPVHELIREFLAPAQAQPVDGGKED